ncbi:hypothetical protein EXS74_01960 [Candidatus Woesearchaeota archaeon]|nr:hypothetical protein [Candidatus Woesearchaeota archaeon]
MVNHMFLHPQEIETFYILPTLRRYFALYLKERGLKQKDIANMLMINTATISQYTSTKRGHKITLNEFILKEIKKSAENIHDQISYIRETQRILKVIRFSGAICEIHKQVSAVPEGCEQPVTGCHTTILTEKAK